MRVLRLSVALVLILASHGCDKWLDALEPDPEAVPADEILSLSRLGDPLPIPADGISSDTLVARIPSKASARVITFSTTAGYFGLTAHSKTIKVRAESDGSGQLVAKAALISATNDTTAVVSAIVNDFTRYLMVRMESH